MFRPEIYIKIRREFELGHPEAEIKAKFIKYGYNAEDIDTAISEYAKDESSKAAALLISEIERRYRALEQVEDIANDLITKGFDPLEVQKALLRARMEEHDTSPIGQQVGQLLERLGIIKKANK